MKNRIEEFKNQQGETKVGFLKKHRGEILAAVGAVAATSAVFIFKGRRVDLGYLSINLRLGERRVRSEHNYGHMSFNTLDQFTIGDLGKVGEDLIKRIPDISADTKLENISVNYDFC